MHKSVKEEREKLDYNLDKLNRIERLHEEFGYEMSSVSPELISQVKFLLQNLSEQPDIFPIDNKGIQIEYEKETGEYLEFELFEDNSVHIFKVCADGTEFEETFKFDLTRINEYVNNFYSSCKS